MKSVLLSLLFLLPCLPLHAQDDREIEILCLEKVNAIRQQGPAKALSRNSKLDSAAALQIRWCAENQVLSHQRPSGRLRTVQDRIEHVKYKYANYGENILFFMPDEDETAEALAAHIVQQWVESPGHYANMRKPVYRDTGFAVAWSADGERLYACQVFALERKPKKGKS